MKLNAHPHRAGFTLVELLVVISIVAILIGFGIGGTMRFRGAATNRACDDQLKQLQIALNGQYQDVVNKCHKEPVPDKVIEYCDGDQDRARAVHTAATLRIYFPDTADEAKNGFTINGHPYNAKATFKAVANSALADDAAPGATKADKEAAALLYLVLQEQAAGVGNSEVNTQASVRDGFRMFIDPRGNPVRYSRWARSAELNLPPYSPTTPANFDPLDPKQKVAGWGAPNGPTRLATLNSAAGGGLGFGTSATTGSNRVPSVVSVGKDKTFNGFAAVSDDHIGYRLNRQGAQGSKP